MIGQFSLHTIRNKNGTRHTRSLQPGSHIDAISVHRLVPEDNVSDVNTNPHRYRVVRLVSLLHLNPTMDSVKRTFINTQTAIAIEGNDFAVVFCRELFQVFSVDSHLLEGGLLVLLNKSRVALNVRKHYRGEFPYLLVSHEDVCRVSYSKVIKIQPHVEANRALAY